MNPTIEATNPSAGVPDDDPVEKSRMTLGEHLGELRRRLIRASVAVTLAFIVLFSFRVHVSNWISGPYQSAVSWLNDDLVTLYGERLAEDSSLDWREYFRDGYPESVRLVEEKAIPSGLQLLGIGSGFFFDLRVCFWLALFIGGPICLWEAWQFVAAGLYGKEKRVVHAYFPASLGLFVGGVAFGFFIMVPYAIYFLEKGNLARPAFDPHTASVDYLQFLKGLSLALGVVFQLPVVMLALSRTGIVDPRIYPRYRGHMLIIALLVSAILTPPDPVTQLMLAGPVVLLYEIGIWIARASGKKAREAATT